jgi:hypothetical protein
MNLRNTSREESFQAFRRPHKLSEWVVSSATKVILLGWVKHIRKGCSHYGKLLCSIWSPNIKACFKEESSSSR